MPAASPPGPPPDRPLARRRRRRRPPPSSAAHQARPPPRPTPTATTTATTPVLLDLPMCVLRAIRRKITGNALLGIVQRFHHPATPGARPFRAASPRPRLPLLTPTFASYRTRSVATSISPRRKAPPAFALALVEQLVDEALAAPAAVHQQVLELLEPVQMALELGVAPAAVGPHLPPAETVVRRAPSPAARRPRRTISSSSSRSLRVCGGSSSSDPPEDLGAPGGWPPRCRRATPRRSRAAGRRPPHPRHGAAAAGAGAAAPGRSIRPRYFM